MLPVPSTAPSSQREQLLVLKMRKQHNLNDKIVLIIYKGLNYSLHRAVPKSPKLR